MMDNANFDILMINAGDAWNNSCCYRSRGGDGVKENDGDGGEPHHGFLLFATKDGKIFDHSNWELHRWEDLSAVTFWVRYHSTNLFT